jgi:hypothetical protein
LRRRVGRHPFAASPARPLRGRTTVASSWLTFYISKNKLLFFKI